MVNRTQGVMKMDHAAGAVEVTVWADAAGAATAEAVLARMGDAVRCIGVGGPREAAVDALAAALDCPREDDLRKLLIDRPATCLLLATMRGASVANVRTAAHQGTHVLALEPPVAERVALPALAAVASWVTYVPAFEACPGLHFAAEPAEAMGPLRSVRFESLGRRGEGSLFARLLDAWRTVLGHVPPPATIDAALGRTGGEAPEALRDLTGALTAHGRPAGDGAGVLVHVADRAAAAGRALCVLGEEGQLDVHDAGYRLRRADGALLDEAHEPAALNFAELVAHQWRRLIDRLASGPPEPVSTQRERDALACCLACLLSIRTGQAESPAKLAEMG